jgi:hypothetical protein
LDYHGGDERDEVFSADEEHRVDSEAEGSFVEEEDLGSQGIPSGGRGEEYLGDGGGGERFTGRDADASYHSSDEEHCP